MTYLNSQSATPLQSSSGQTILPPVNMPSNEGNNHKNNQKRGNKEDRSSRPSSKLGLRARTILTAIALTTVPIMLIGTVAYQVTKNRITRQINEVQYERAQHLSHLLEDYIKSRASEGEILASNSIFTDPNINEKVTINQKKAVLDAFKKKIGYYDSIAYLDLQGNVLFQSQSQYPLRENYSDRQYFQSAMANKRTTMNTVGISKVTGEPRMEFAVPVTDGWTDELIGVLRLRIPNQGIEPLLSDHVDQGEYWYLINSEKSFSFSAVENLQGEPVKNYYPQLNKAHANKQNIAVLAKNPLNSQLDQLVNYAPIKVGAINPQLNLGTAIAFDTDIAFAPLMPLRWIFIGGALASALLASSIAGFLANRIAQTISRLTSTVNQLGQGKLDTRVKLESNRPNEFARLGEQINQMADNFESSSSSQTTMVRTSELMTQISLAQNTRDLQLPFSKFLEGVRRFIKADRVVFYQFDEQWWGTIVAESVAQNFPRTLGVQFDDPCFAQDYVAKYQRGRIQAVSDIYQADLTECHLQQLEPYGVKASLVLPIITQVESADKPKLVGLLIAHQCSSTRVWSQSDIEYLRQVTRRLEVVLKNYVYHQQENTQKLDVQKNFAYLLRSIKNISPSNSANLTSQAVSSADLAKSLNQMLDNIRQTIAQIKIPAQKINQELTLNRQHLADLNYKLRQQTNQLALVFNFIEQITNSANEISSQANSTAQSFDLAVTELELEKANFNQAISSTLQLQSTIKENRDKFNRLNSASQKMTRLISAIKKNNLRVSLLAGKLIQRIPENDSTSDLQIESELIKQSVVTTKELEEVMLNVKQEISEVLQSYQISVGQLEQEKYLAGNPSRNLEQIVRIVKEAQQNLTVLMSNSKMQLQTSDKINELRNDLEQNSQIINQASDLTIESLDQLSLTAKDIANVTSFFKLEQKAEHN